MKANVFVYAMLVFSFSTWAQSDFRIETTTQKYYTLAHKKNIDLQDCRDHIREVMCLVDPIPNNEHVDPLNRPCLDGGINYAKFYEELFDHYPASLQKMFCSLQRIFVEKDFFGSAYAGLLKNAQDEIIGAQMGIRKSLLDEEMTLSKWATWKEQLSFGGNPANYETKIELPQVYTKNSFSKVNDFLYFVTAHEFGHIFDFSNQLNKIENCSPETPENTDPECEITSDSFGAIGWKTTKLPHLENHFFHFEDLCFYWCTSSVPMDDAVEIYNSFFDTSFISLYSSTQAWDDLAETLAYTLLFEQLKASYTISVTDPVTTLKYFWDIKKKFESPVLAEKKLYLKRFFLRENIIYP